FHPPSLERLDRARDDLVLLPPLVAQRPQPRVREREGDPVDTRDREDPDRSAQPGRETDRARRDRAPLTCEQHALDPERGGVRWLDWAWEKTHPPEGAPAAGAPPSDVPTSLGPPRRAPSRRLGHACPRPASGTSRAAGTTRRCPPRRS